MKSKHLLFGIGGIVAISVIGAALFGGGAPKKKRVAAEQPPAISAPASSNDPFGGLGAEPSLPPEHPDNGPQVAEVPMDQGPGALPPPGASRPAAACAAECGPRVEDLKRIEELEEQVEMLRAKAGRSAARAASPAPDRAHVASLPASRSASRITHGPLIQTGNQIRAVIRWTGANPDLALTRVDAETVQVIARNARAPDRVPKTALLDKAEMEIAGADRRFVYRAFGSVDGTLLRKPGNQAELVLNVTAPKLGPAESEVVVKADSATAVEDDATRWVVRAVTSNSAVLYRPADSLQLPVAVGSTIPSCGSVLAILPQTAQVRADCGLLARASGLR